VDTGEKKNKGKKNYMSIEASISLFKAPCAWWMKKKFIQTLGNVPSRYARNFLLVCYVSNKWRQKWMINTELRISKSQEAFPHLFFLLGEEGELWGFFLDFNVPNAFPPSYGYPLRLWIRIYLQTMIDTIVVLSVLLHLLAYYSEEVWDWELGRLGDWECLWCTYHLVSS